MGLTFKRKESLERMFEEFAIDPDKIELPDKIEKPVETNLSFNVTQTSSLTNEKKDEN